MSESYENNDNNIIKPFELITITNSPHLPTNTGNSVFIFPPKSTDLTRYWSPGVYRYNGGITYTIDYPDNEYKNKIETYHPENPIGGYNYSVLRTPIDYYTFQFNYLSGPTLQFATLEFWTYIDIDTIPNNITKPVPSLYFAGPNATEELQFSLGGPYGWIISYTNKYGTENKFETIYNPTYDPNIFKQKWIHTAFSFTGTYIYVYINGTVVYKLDQNLFNSNLFNSLTFYLFNTNNSSFQFQNYLCNIRMSDFVRYPKEFNISLPNQPYDFSESTELPKSDPIISSETPPFSIDDNIITIYALPISDSINKYGTDKEEFKETLKCSGNISNIETSTDDNRIIYLTKPESNSAVDVRFYLTPSDIPDNIFDRYTFDLFVYLSYNGNGNPFCVFKLAQSNEYEFALDFYFENTSISIRKSRTESETKNVTSENICELNNYNFKDQWVHIALVYDKESYCIIFVNGTEVARIESSSFNFKLYQAYITLWHNRSTTGEINKFNISNIRFSQGIRYNANFNYEDEHKPITCKYESDISVVSL